ncbi:MAG: NADH-quinone oxidoreductase subunit A [Candidatus Omnitrophica bacterium]|nr:NADH-quinone oxidoreductase subunit A [Candidatus Omnitrophota bacterium]
MLLDYFWVFSFILISLAFAGVAVLLPYLLAPKSKAPAHTSTYESGMPTIGSAWIQFHVLYYLYALVFLVFDVEVIFLFPLALAFRKIQGMWVLWETVIFIGILGLALLYAIRKEVFRWK